MAASSEVSRRWPWAALLLAALAMGLLAAQQLQELDPAQYADVARRMFESGDWAHMEDTFGPFLNKPPLMFWLMCGSFRVFGLTSFAARLPTLLAGIGLLVATARIGERLWNRRTGLWAAALVGSSVAFQLMVADPKIDLLLAALMSGAVACAIEARERPGWMWGAWLSAALGLLAKGPIGVAGPAMAVLPEALRSGWRRALRPVLGPGLVCVAYLPWFWATYRQFGDEGLKHHLWEQGPGRIFDPYWSNGTTPFFFVHTLLWAFLPFAFILLAALAARAGAWIRARGRLPANPSRVVVWWFGLGFLAIAPAGYRLPQYLFWWVAPAALLSAHALESGALHRLALRALTVLHVGLALLVPLAVLGIVTACFPMGVAGTALWTLGTGVISVGGLWLARKLELAERLALTAVASLSAFGLFFAGHLHPALLEYQPDRGIGALAREADPKGRILPFFGALASNGAAFYSDRTPLQVDEPLLSGVWTRGESRIAVLSPEAERSLRAADWSVTEVGRLPSFATSRPSRAFLLARSRLATLDEVIVARVSPRAGAALPR